MKIKFKPFRLQLGHYRLKDGTVYPPKFIYLNRLFLVLAILTAVLLFLASCTKPVQEIVQPPVQKPMHTEDMPTLEKQADSITIVLSDIVDGRQTYSVLFSDGTGLDSMYPEEIANGLITGKWDYDEDLTLTK